MSKKDQPKSSCKVSHVGVRISVWVLSFTGFVLSALAVASCRYLKRVTTTLYGSLDIEYHGLYNFQASYTCISSSLLSSLPSSEGTSSSLKAARAFGVLSALFGGVTTIWILISIMFTGTNKPLWTTMASLLTVSTAFQLLTFIAFNDDGCKDNAENEFTSCSFEEGAAFALSASLFYLLSSIGMFLVSHPQVPLVSLQEGWRGGADIAKVAHSGDAHTAVIVNEEPHVPHTSSTSPPKPKGAFKNNLVQAGATILPGVVEDEYRGTSSSTDAVGDTFGVEL